MLLQDSLLGALAVQVIWGLCWVASRTEPWPDTWTLVSIDTRTPWTRLTLVSIDTPPQRHKIAKGAVAQDSEHMRSCTLSH